MCPGSIQNTRRKKVPFIYHYRTGFMVKLIKVQCNAFDADGKNGFTSESVHVPQPVV